MTIQCKTVYTRSIYIAIKPISIDKTRLKFTGPYAMFKNSSGLYQNFPIAGTKYKIQCINLNVICY